MDALSLYDLNVLVRRSLEQCLPDTYWIQAELSILISYYLSWKYIAKNNLKNSNSFKRGDRKSTRLNSSHSV